jgi:hypothetical protein
MVCVYWSFNLAERKQVTAKTRLTLHYIYFFQPLTRTVATFIIHFALQVQILSVLYGPKARQGEQPDCSFCLL